MSKSEFWADLPNYILLLLLYIFQGAPGGLFRISIPTIFKKYLSYIDLGYMSWASIPFSCKLFFAAFVEKYYIKSIGQRKTWIIPAQLAAAAIIYRLSFVVEDLLKESKAIEITL